MGLLSAIFGKKDNSELESALAAGAYLVDVRSAAEFAGGSVKGAVNIPLGAISTQLSKFKGKQNTVVFCRSGNRSAQAKSILVQNGVQNVTDGGTWQNVASCLTNNN